LMFFSCSLWAGQNSGAGIRFDMDSATIGNQNLTNIECPGADILIRVDVYVINAVNLDNYELNIGYNSSDLTFISGEEDQPVTSEDNFLKMNRGSTIGFTCTATISAINCANTLQGDQGESTPDDEGLLVSLQFRTLVDCPRPLSFELVEWYDNEGEIDIGIDKGEDVSLPVELCFFSLYRQNEGVLITWETASEVNNHGYNLLRSTMDTLFYAQLNTKLIAGRGNTSTSANYNYLDASAVNGYTYYYKLEQIDFSGKLSYFGPKSICLNQSEVQKNKLPEDYTLSQNYPNPFNPKTNINYELPITNYIELEIYNLIGQNVATLVSEKQTAGTYQVEWNASHVPSGIYYYIFKTGQFTDIKKMILLK